LAAQHRRAVTRRGDHRAGTRVAALACYSADTEGEIVLAVANLLWFVFAGSER